MPLNSQRSAIAEQPEVITDRDQPHGRDKEDNRSRDAREAPAARGGDDRSDPITFAVLGSRRMP